MIEYMNDYQFDSLDYNQTPSIKEIEDAINEREQHINTQLTQQVTEKTRKCHDQMYLPTHNDYP